MAAPDEKKSLLKRGFTKRAGKKVRHLLQRARGHRKTDDADKTIENPSTLTHSYNSSQSSLEDEEDYVEYTSRKASSSSKDSKFSQSSWKNRPEKLADRSLTPDHRSRKSSSHSFEQYDRQRAIIKPTESRTRTMSLTSASEHIRPKGALDCKQSSSIVVVPAAAPGPSPPTTPTSVPATSEYSSTRSVEELSVASEKEAIVVAKEELATNNDKEEKKQDAIPVVEDGSYVLPVTTMTMPITTASATEAAMSKPVLQEPSTTQELTTEQAIEAEPAVTNVSTATTVATTMTGESEVSERLAYFDKQQSGRITMLDTFTSLRQLGYHWMFAIPATLIMHLRLSPLTIHHPRSFREWLSLPIYTDRVAQALASHTPLVHRREQVSKWVDLYGRRKDSVRGLAFWDGFRALRGAERTTLRWWQIRLWLAHRLQWILTYSMLHDPQTRMVTQPALEYLCPSSDCKQ